jgi:formate hydrogenlyase subunit 3/multisubunit Na+/H+ antiporter MnhD subunit
MAPPALNMADLRPAHRRGGEPIIASAAFLIFAFASKAALFRCSSGCRPLPHAVLQHPALFSALLTKVEVMR